MVRPLISIMLFALLALSSPALSEDKEKPAEKRTPTLAHVKIAGDLGDRQAPELPFGRPPLTYRSFIQILEKAQSDPEIQGIFLEVKEPEIGLAKAEGALHALARFKKSGKKLYVYAEELTAPGVVLAAAADRWAMPEGGVLILPGVSAEVLYLKGLFDLLGIEWLVVQEKEYKSAFESLVRDRMSPETREVLEGITDQRYRTIVEAIAEGRRLAPDRVREAIDEAILPARRAKELGLIDEVAYRDEFEASLKTELGGELTLRRNYGRGSREIDLSNPFALFTQIAKLLSPSESRRHDSAPKIAVVYAEGPITSGKSAVSPFGGAGTVGSETMVKAIDQAAEDDTVKAIVLRIDSPGGSGLASDVIWRALMRAREKKPLIASLSDVAASGGYYIAMAAHTIVAEPGTLTGSIGVIAARPSLERLLGFWGIRAERIQRGKSAGLFDLFHPPSDGERLAITRYVAGFYKEFVAKVARSRGLSEEEVEKAARGRVWTGEEAKKKRLVDELGGFEDALALARNRAGLEDPATRDLEYPEPPDFFEALSEMFEMRAQGPAAGGAGAEGRALLGALPAGAAALSALGADGTGLLSRLWQLRMLSGERVLALLPFELLDR